MRLLIVIAINAIACCCTVAAQALDTLQITVTPEQKRRLEESEQQLLDGVKSRNEGRSQEALELVNKALATHEEVLGPNHEFTLDVLSKLAEIQLSSQNARAALPMFERLLAAASERHGPQHPKTADALSRLGSALHRLGNYEAALGNFQKAHKIRKEALGPRHVSTVDSLNDLGFAEQALGDYAAAAVHFQEAVTIGREVLDRKSPLLATSLNNLGYALTRLGRFAEARPYYEEALAIRKEGAGLKHPITALSQSNLAGLLRDIGNLKEAKALYEEALATRLQSLGPKHPDTADAYNNLAAIEVDFKQYDAAMDNYSQSLATYRAIYGEKHPLTAAAVANVAYLYAEQGQFAKSLSHYLQALRMQEELLGSRHPDVANTRNNLATLYSTQNNFADAKPLMETSLSVLGSTFGSRHPRTIIAHTNLALVLGHQRKAQAAAEHFNHARRGVHQYVRTVLPGMTEKEQLTFLLHTDRSNFDTAISIIQARKSHPELIPLTASWVLNGKSVAQECLIQQATLQRLSTDQSLKPLTEAVAKSRRKLAALANQAPPPGEHDAYRKQVSAIQGQFDEESRRLMQATSRTSFEARWIDISALQKALPADAVLIEFVRLQPYNFLGTDAKTKVVADRYFCWAIGAKSLVFFDLGPAANIDKAVGTVRAAMAEAGKVISSDGEVAAERRLREASEDLTRLVVQPLLKAPIVKGAKELILSPDGQLWLAPWQALPVEDDKYLVERFRLRYVVSGRQLVDKANDNISSARPVLFADPDYDLPMTEKAAAESVKASPQHTSGLPDGMPGLKKALPRVDRLPGTAVEAQAIAPSIGRYTSNAPEVHTGTAALEHVFKRLSAPRILVLSTHGYFLADEPKVSNGFSPNERLRLPENPLLRCGLLLAGCNSGNAATNVDDGVLTGLEISGIDLQNTELVVLSACETGLGTVRDGEGVAGLRQAFQLAGAKNVVSTLWQIPDIQSAKLMIDFFSNLADGQSKPESLQNAQLKMIRERRSRGDAAHPFFWAAWTVTGS